MRTSCRERRSCLIHIRRDSMRRFAFVNGEIIIKIVLDPFAKRWDQCKHGLDLCLHWQWSSDEAKPVKRMMS